MPTLYYNLKKQSNIRQRQSKKREPLRLKWTNTTNCTCTNLLLLLTLYLLTLLLSTSNVFYNHIRFGRLFPETVLNLFTTLAHPTPLLPPLPFAC